MPKRVLVVDNDPTLVRLCKLVLEREGYLVLGAFSGAQCLDSLARYPVDLILLDPLLEDTEGWELLDRIGADSRWASIPVVAVTNAFLRPKSPNHMPRQRLAGYLRKPFQISNLLEQVRLGVARA